MFSKSVFKNSFFFELISFHISGGQPNIALEEIFFIQLKSNQNTLIKSVQMTKYSIILTKMPLMFSSKNNPSFLIKTLNFYSKKAEKNMERGGLFDSCFEKLFFLF